MNKIKNKNSGQALLITVLAISATIIGATTIAGLLTFYQIRQATDVVNSTKAIFAADAGLEWGAYQFFTVDNGVCPTGGVYPETALDNEAKFSVTCSVDQTSGKIIFKSIGTSGRTQRALKQDFTPGP